MAKSNCSFPVGSRVLGTIILLSILSGYVPGTEWGASWFLVGSAMVRDILLVLGLASIVLLMMRVTVQWPVVVRIFGVVISSACGWLILCFAMIHIENPYLSFSTDLPEKRSTVYVVNDLCIPPDSAFECIEGAVLIYTRPWYSPLATLRMRLKFKVNTVEQRGSKVFVSGDYPVQEIVLPL